MPIHDAIDAIMPDFMKSGVNPESIKHMHPDMSKFIQTVNAEDLSRPNMFLVRFGIFKPNEQAGSYTLNKLKELGMTIAMEAEIGKVALGAYNPALIKPIMGLFGLGDNGYMEGDETTLAGVLPKDFDPNRELSMLVKSVSIPGTNLDTAKLYHSKYPMTTVTGRSVNTITMTIYLSPSHLQRAVMLAWMNEAHDQETNEFGLYDDFAREIDIYPLDRRGVPSSVTQCTKCFPIRVGDVQYDVDSNNTIATVEVEFAISTVHTTRYVSDSPMIDKIYSGIDNVLPTISQF